MKSGTPLKINFKNLILKNENFCNQAELDEIQNYCYVNTPDLTMDSSSSYTSYIKHGYYSIFNLQKSKENLNPLKKELKSPKEYFEWTGKLSIITKITNFYPEAVSCHIAIMHPNTELKLHVDTVSKYYYRFHIPITSNKESFFYFKQNNILEKHSVINGNCYYFNTSVNHYADNYGSTDRIHITWLMPIKTLNKYVE